MWHISKHASYNIKAWKLYRHSDVAEIARKTIITKRHLFSNNLRSVIIRPPNHCLSFAWLHSSHTESHSVRPGEHSAGPAFCVLISHGIEMTSNFPLSFPWYCEVCKNVRHGKLSSNRKTSCGRSLFSSSFYWSFLLSKGCSGLLVSEWSSSLPSSGW